MKKKDWPNKTEAGPLSLSDRYEDQEEEKNIFNKGNRYLATHIIRQEHSHSCSCKQD